MKQNQIPECSSMDGYTSSEVDFVERQDKSLMPDLQIKDLTAQQVADLVEFIKSAK